MCAVFSDVSRVARVVAPRRLAALLLTLSLLTTASAFAASPTTPPADTPPVKTGGAAPAPDTRAPVVTTPTPRVTPAPARQDAQARRDALRARTLAELRSGEPKEARRQRVEPGKAIGRALLGLLLVCGLCYVGLRWGVARVVAPNRQQHISVLARQQIEPNRALLVVDVAGRALVLGSSEAGVSLICELGDEARVFRPEETAASNVQDAVEADILALPGAADTGASVVSDDEAPEAVETSAPTTTRRAFADLMPLTRPRV